MPLGLILWKRGLALRCDCRVWDCRWSIKAAVNMYLLLVDRQFLGHMITYYAKSFLFI